jgi:pimeloyl-ACP methyl ester carboxylesterase
MPIAAGIYYAQFNEGYKELPPVILIHGAGSSHLIWPAALRRLAGQRVLAIDLPGHGHSSGLAQQSIKAYSNQMIEFLAALGLYQAVFVGHSMGGAIALEMAISHPGHVAGLGLIASGAYLGVDPKFIESLSNAITADSAYAGFLERAFGPAASPALLNLCIQAQTNTRSSVQYGDWRACAEFDARESAGHIEAPTWLITGSEDRVTPVAYANFLADRLPAARLQVIPGAGHMVLLEQPERVAQGLQQFLSALAAARFTAARVQLPMPVQVSITPRFS